jgi:DNA-binding NtrC family response regulator
MDTHLLLVDDDPADLLIISEGLMQRWEGLVPETTRTAEEALTLLATSSYDVVVSDMRLPGRGGIHLAREVLKARPDTPVFLMTAFGPSQKEEALRAGAIDYLEKPLDLDLLVPRMKEALEKAKLRRRVREVNLRSSQEVVSRARGEPVRKEIREFFRSTELLLALLKQGEPLTDFEWEVFENCSLHLRSFLAIKQSLDTRRATNDPKLPDSDDKGTE